MGNEQEVDETNDELEETTTDETQDETQTNDNSEEITYEQALEWKKQAEGKTKAEQKLVELKRQLKETKKPDNVTINSKEEFDRFWEEKEFYKTNPDANSYKKEIESYQSKGLSLDDAYSLASKKDKEIEENRSIYWQSILKWSANTESLSSVSIDTFDKMTPTAQKEYSNKMIQKYWKIRFK